MADWAISGYTAHILSVSDSAWFTILYDSVRYQQLVVQWDIITNSNHYAHSRAASLLSKDNAVSQDGMLVVVSQQISAGR